MGIFPDYSNRPFYKNPYFLGGSAALVAGAFFHWWRGRADTMPVAKPVTTPSGPLDLLTTNLTDEQAAVFKKSLPPAGQKYAEFFVLAARNHDVSPFMLAGIMAVETNFGLGCRDPLPRCRGYAGNDYGLMQINDKAHPAFFAKTVNGRPAYEDPQTVIDYGASVLGGYKKLLASRTKLTGTDLLRAAASSYNAGPGNVLKALAKGRSPDSVTTGGDYGKKALQRAMGFLNSAAVA